MWIKPFLWFYFAANLMILLATWACGKMDEATGRDFYFKSYADIKEWSRFVKWTPQRLKDPLFTILFGSIILIYQAIKDKYKSKTYLNGSGGQDE